MSVDTASSFSIALKPDDVFRRPVFNDDYEFLPPFLSFLAGSTVTQSSQNKKRKNGINKRERGPGPICSKHLAHGGKMSASRYSLSQLTCSDELFKKVIMDEFLFTFFILTEINHDATIARTINGNQKLKRGTKPVA